MILHCTFEELTALGAGAELALGREGAGAVVRVAAPPDIVAAVEALVPRLHADITLETLAEQRNVERAIGFIVDALHEHMTTTILDEYPGAENAVAAYFDWAHAIVVQDRVRRIGAAMAALLEVMTGRPPTRETAEGFTFPDED